MFTGHCVLPLAGLVIRGNIFSLTYREELLHWHALTSSCHKLACKTGYCRPGKDGQPNGNVQFAELDPRGLPDKLYKRTCVRSFVLLLKGSRELSRSWGIQNSEYKQERVGKELC